MSDVCAICLEPHATADRIALICGHYFHESCLRRSLHSATPISSCPLCRGDVVVVRHHATGAIVVETKDRCGNTVVRELCE